MCDTSRGQRCDLSTQLGGMHPLYNCLLKRGSLGQLQKNTFMFSAGRDKEGMRNVS